MTNDQLEAFTATQAPVMANEVCSRWGYDQKVSQIFAAEMMLCFEIGYLLGEPEHRFGYAIKKDGCLAVTLWYTVNEAGIYHNGNKLTL